jgi:uncharacterized protein
MPVCYTKPAAPARCIHATARLRPQFPGQGRSHRQDQCFSADYKQKDTKITIFPTMNIFTNPVDHRPRAGWRLFFQFVLMIILVIAGQFLVSGFADRTWSILMQGLMITLSIWIAARVFDRRELAEYGLRTGPRWWQDLAFGVGAGVLALTAIFITFYAAGWLTVTGSGWGRSSTTGFLLSFFRYFLLMAAVGFYEELLTRGYQIKNLAEGLHAGPVSPATALILAGVATSVVFSILHIGNPNISMTGLINIALVGMVFAFSFLLTNRLAIAIGIHFSWNFTMGAIYGLPVSGIRFRESILQSRVTGPELWTGGKFGPEGGIIGFLALILLFALILAYLKYRDGELRIRTEIVDRPPGDIQQ